MEFIMKYSGIVAIFVYLFLLLIVVGINKLLKKNKKEEVIQEEVKKTISTKEYNPLNIDDEDALVACLVASIDCRNEYHKNVKIVSVKEI